MKPAAICYVEIPAPDVERAGSFYSSVFGWKIEPSGLTEQKYWMFSTGENQLMGGLTPDLPVQDGGVIFYLKVEDISETLAAVLKAGGAPVQETKEIGGGFGYSAVFRDPNGNRIGLWSNL